MDVREELFVFCGHPTANDKQVGGEEHLEVTEIAG
jgi:hypothetical protein